MFLTLQAGHLLVVSKYNVDGSIQTSLDWPHAMRTFLNLFYTYKDEKVDVNRRLLTRIDTKLRLRNVQEKTLSSILKCDYIEEAIDEIGNTNSLWVFDSRNSFCGRAEGCLSREQYPAASGAAGISRCMDY
ncbi:MAG TPA: hypothetical protein VGN23_06445 [Verrucomicrobiae bacterium]|jgi:hypothetical protein